MHPHAMSVLPVKNAERILQGLPGWEPITAVPEAAVTGRELADKAKAGSRQRKSKDKLDC
jgi:hypothetical protein